MFLLHIHKSGMVCIFDILFTLFMYLFINLFVYLFILTIEMSLKAFCTELTLQPFKSAVMGDSYITLYY